MSYAHAFGPAGLVGLVPGGSAPHGLRGLVAQKPVEGALPAVPLNTPVMVGGSESDRESGSSEFSFSSSQTVAPAPSSP